MSGFFPCWTALQPVPKVGISLAEAKRANPDENGVFRSSEQPNKINDLNVAADRLTPAGPTVE